MTEPIKLNAYQVMKNFRKLAADDLEYFAVAIDYLPELNQLYTSLADDPKAKDVKVMIDEITASQNKYNVETQNPG